LTGCSSHLSLVISLFYNIDPHTIHNTTTTSLSIEGRLR
jgi:hypothetical protein